MEIVQKEPLVVRAKVGDKEIFLTTESDPWLPPRTPTSRWWVWYLIFLPLWWLVKWFRTSATLILTVELLLLQSLNKRYPYDPTGSLEFTLIMTVVVLLMFLLWRWVRRGLAMDAIKKKILQLQAAAEDSVR